MWLLLKKLRVMAVFVSLLNAACFAHVYGKDNPDPKSKEDFTTSEEAGGSRHGFIGFRTSVYHNDDDGDDGNPFLDEKLTVIEPVIIFDYNVSDKTAFWGKFSYDYVSSASIDRLSKFPRQSGASGDYYYGLDLGARRKLSDTLRVGGFASGSMEYDYDSFGFGGDIAKDSADRNRTIKLSVNGFLDQVEIIRHNGLDTEGSDDRISLSSTLNWYQIIDPKTHSELGTMFSYQTGFLETAFNAVVIEIPPNVEIPEELPGKRIRGAIFGRIRRYVDPQSAIELYGRLYTDTWGINSLTTEPQVHHWLIEGVVRMRLRYRFYIQTEADGFEDHFFFEDRDQRFRTQDSDLGDFTSHTLGIKFDWHLATALKFDISSDYVFRSDNLDQIVGSIGLTRKF